MLQQYTGHWTCRRNVQRAVKKQTLSQFTFSVYAMFSTELQFWQETNNQNLST
jgi:hypothetical protein